MSKLLLKWICAAVFMMGTYALVPTPTLAMHGWASYHWPRTSAAIKDIPIREYHSAVWLTRYNTAVADWRKPALTKIRVKHSFNGTPKPTFATCPPVAGQISSCDGFYGATGWLGLGGFYYSGSHITKGMSWVNNTYYAMPYYNNIPWRQLVICQEIGHALGLKHVNEISNNANTGSCMDYTNDPDGGSGGASSSDPNNMHPNAHDYTTLNTRHNHIGSILPGFNPEFDETAAAQGPEPAEMATFTPMRISDLGQLVSIGDGGRTEQYHKDFGNGYGFVSFVIRAK